MGEYAEEAGKSLGQNGVPDKSDGDDDSAPDDEKRNDGAALLAQQLSALLWKKALYAWRSPALSLAQLLLPLLFTLVALAQLKTMPESGDAPALRLRLASFKSADVRLFTFDDLANDSAVRPLAAAYRRQVASPDRLLVTRFRADAPLANLSQEALLAAGEADLWRYNLHAPVGLALDANASLLALFNNQAFHTPGIAVALADAAIAAAVADAAYRLEVVNHPFPRTVYDRLVQQQNQVILLFQFFRHTCRCGVRC